VSPAILAKSPDGMDSRVVLYRDDATRPRVVAVALEPEFRAKFPKWALFHVHVTEHQFNQFENFRLKREGGAKTEEPSLRL